MPEGLAKTVLGFGLDRISTSNNCQFCANKLNCLISWFTLFYFIQPFLLSKTLEMPLLFMIFWSKCTKLPVEKNVYMHDKMGMVLTQLVCHLNPKGWNFSLKNFCKSMISSLGSDQAGQVGVTISIKTFFVRFPAVPIWISLHQFKTGDQFRLHFWFH